MADFSALSRYDVLVLAFGAVSVAINLAVLSWMFVRLDRVIAENGSMDLYLNFLGRPLGWQLLATVAHACLYALI
jgi:hypothetical protein